MDPNEVNLNQNMTIQSKYYSISDFNENFTKTTSELNPTLMSNFSLFHWNARSLNKNFDSFELLLSSLQNYPFSVIGITETWLRPNSSNIFNIENYKLFRSDRKKGRGGGVAFYVHNLQRIKVRPDIHIEGCEDLFIEIINEKYKNKIVGVIYRPPNYASDVFLNQLENCLNIITRENKEVYFMGDFNIDMTKTDMSALKLLNTLSSFAFHNHVQNPTRITQTSKTLLDNIFSNATDSNEFTNGILYFDASDHLPIFTISQRTAPKNINSPTHIIKRNETDNNIELLKSDLGQEEWNDVFLETDADKAYDIFLNKLIFYYNKNIPLIKKKIHKKNKHPWITKGIMRSIKTRNKMYKIAITTQCDHDHDKYKKYRNKLNGLIRLSRKMYYSEKCENNAKNVNGLWDIVNDISGKHNKENTSVYYDNDKELTQPNEISDAFNSYFTNIGPKLASKIANNINRNFTEFLPQRFHKSLFLTPTDEEEIYKIVRCLKPSNSTGHDGLSVNLLKKIITCIIAPLTYIFNISISTGKCPNSLKIAKVIPIFKKDDPSLLTNYRPISILPSISKILEKIVHKRLYIFLNINNLLVPNQFGFRKKYSTDYAIVQLLNKVTECFANKEHLIGIFMDLSKAFDTIDHDILIYKLKRYGIQGIALSWIVDYLSNRKQYVAFKSSESTKSKISCGVPQGSILGPLLFLIYINDIANTSQLLSFILFADDTNIFYSHKNFDTLVTTLNSEISKVAQWFSCNKLSLNISKTNFIKFRPYKSADIGNASSCHIHIDGMPIVENKSTKFLGITIDSTLSWNDHIHNVHTSVSRGIGILYRLRNLISQKSLTILYNALLLPYITYCNIVWGNCGTTKTNPILLLQKRAMRVITNSHYLSPSGPLFSQLKTLKIHDIHTFQTAIFMHKYSFNQLPSVFDNFFIPNSHIHSYPTRHSSDYHLENPKVVAAQKSLKHHGPDIWNSLDTSLKQCSSISSFKKQLKGSLLSSYVSGH